MKTRAKKRKITFAEAFIISSKHFNPLRLSDFLKNDCGIAIVDRNLVIQSDEEDQAFFWLLDHIYRWDFGSDYSNTTVYIECENVNTEKYNGKVIYCGVYDEAKHEKLSRKLSASQFPARFPSGYIYTEEEIKRIVKNIGSTTARL